MSVLEVIKIIPVIKQIWGYFGSSQNIKIEVSPNQIFQTQWKNNKLDYTFSNNNKGIALNITNYEKENIRLDQITLRVYVKKWIFCKVKIFDVEGGKFKGGFSAEIIPPNGDVKYNCGTDFDSSEKRMLIYEVIAKINGRETKHIHKLKNK